MRFPGPVLHEPHTAGRVDSDAAVTALQRATERADGVVRHHRRVTSVEPDGDGVLVRSAAGAAVRARAAVVAAGFSGQGFESAPAVGRLLADLALGAPVDVAPFSLAGHADLH
jgi:glycine/D-amino acid oxidase-like deaminating enzyme